MRIDPRYLTLFLLLAILTYACTPRAAVTETETPPAADIPVVMYADIHTILERSCSPCHFPDEEGGLLALDNFKTVKKNLAEVIKRVELPQNNVGFMPLEMKKEALTKEEILMLKNWAWGGYRQG